MRKVFYAYALSDHTDSEAEAFLNLPASPYEMLDAMDKLRLSEGSDVKFRVDEYYRFGSLVPFLSEPNDLCALNALAQKLSELDDRQEIAFEGLLKMEVEKKGEPIGLPQLINLAYSTDCCHVVDEALNDSQLGRFLAENGFVPGVDDLPDAVFDMLDFERLGRERRQREGGMLMERTADRPGGYVERHSDPVEAYKALNLTVSRPDYIFRIGITRHPDAAETGKIVYLDLPATEEQWQQAENELGDPGWLGTVMDSIDGLVPRLGDMLMSTEDIPDLNRLAQRLADLPAKDVITFKAILEAADCRDLDQAEQLMDTLDEYIFSPQFSSPIEVAKGELSVILCDAEREQIIPYLNLYKYGQELIKDGGGVLTDYGLLERKDGQPVQAVEQQPQQGGMEMC